VHNWKYTLIKRYESRKHDCPVGAALRGLTTPVGHTCLECTLSVVHALAVLQPKISHTLCLKISLSLSLLSASAGYTQWMDIFWTTQRICKTTIFMSLLDWRISSIFLTGGPHVFPARSSSECILCLPSAIVNIQNQFKICPVLHWLCFCSQAWYSNQAWRDHSSLIWLCGHQFLSFLWDSRRLRGQEQYSFRAGSGPAMPACHLQHGILFSAFELLFLCAGH
jgi:hypothetical protein